MCSPVSPCDSYGSPGGAIFTGKVIKIERTSAVKNYGARTFTVKTEKVFLQVEEAFRGVEKNATVTTTTSNEFSCSAGFALNVSYLIRGGFNENKELLTSACGVIALSNAKSSDLIYLRNLPKVMSGARLHGKITAKIKINNQREFVPQFDRRLEYGLRIESVDNSNLTFEAVPDAYDNFEINGVPAGKYRIFPIKPDSLDIELGNAMFYQKDFAEIEVVDKGCANINIAFANNGLIKGRVLDARGNPVKTNIALILADSGKLKESSDKQVAGVFSEQNGSFVFRKVPIGEYKLGINIVSPPSAEKPYPATFFAFQNNPGEPANISIELGETRDDIEIRLPPPLKEKIIRVEVKTPDGNPAVGANVVLENCADKCLAKTNARGEATFTGYEKQNYAVRAYLSNAGPLGVLYARSVQFAISDDAPTIKLLLDPEYDYHKREEK